MNFGVYVISPAKRKSRLKCSKCSLSYTPREYKTLFDSKKLVYFQYTPPEKKRYKVLCHDCLFEVIDKDSEGRECAVDIIDKDTQTQYTCYFAPENEEDVILPHTGNFSGINPSNFDF